MKMHLAGEETLLEQLADLAHAYPFFMGALMQNPPDFLALVVLNEPAVKEKALEYLNQLSSTFGFKVEDIVEVDGMVCFVAGERPEYYASFGAVFGPEVEVNPEDLVLFMYSCPLDELSDKEKEIYESIKDNLMPEISGNA